MANIRTDRFAYSRGRGHAVRVLGVQRHADAPAGAQLRYQLELGGKVVFAQQAKAKVEVCRSTFQGYLKLKAPRLLRKEGGLGQGFNRAKATLRLALADPVGQGLHDTAIEVDVFSVGQAAGLPGDSMGGRDAGQAAGLPGTRWVAVMQGKPPACPVTR